MKNIDINRVLSSLQRIKSTQSVVLRFNEQTGVAGLIHLRELMEANPTVKVSYTDKKIMNSVISTDEWGSWGKHTYRVDGFYYVEEKILRCIFKDVDAVYVDNIGIEGIMSKDIKKREETVRRISNAVFTPNFIKKIKEFGLRPVIFLREEEGHTPSLRIELIEDEIFVLISFVLDGFSGRIAINDVFGDDVYVAPGQFQQVIVGAIEKITEGTTV